MACYKTPAVYVEELSVLPPSIVEVETSTKIANVVRPTLLDIWIDDNKAAIVGNIVKTHHTKMSHSIGGLH